jgi:uncharacterized hydrophobic protein (TIGR00271 family)
MNAKIVSLFGDWRHLVEAPVLVGDVKKAVEKGSIPSFGFFFMLAASGVIATFGLLSNSAAVIIGAMIVAPLMNPIISLAFGGVEVNRVLICRSILTIVIGTIVIITMAFLVSELIGWKLAGSELMARMRPSLLDLGIAVAAGAAAAFAYTRPGVSSALAGIAIGAAVVYGRYCAVTRTQSRHRYWFCNGNCECPRTIPALSDQYIWHRSVSQSDFLFAILPPSRLCICCAGSYWQLFAVGHSAIGYQHG